MNYQHVIIMMLLVYVAWFRDSHSNYEYTNNKEFLDILASK